ncbi:MAG: YgjV family protein [Clostridia bacterium]|nr:YgjV family protein [Clostridia bacterium]
MISTMLTTSYIISQVFALFAYTFLAITFFIKNKTKIVVFNIACSLFFIFHYFFLNASVGMIINFIGVIRGIWYYLDDRFNSTHRIYSLLTCVVASLICSIISFSSWIEIFALLAGLGFTYSLWQKNIGVYRWFMLFCSVLWILYNGLHRSLIAVIGESIMLAIEIVAIIKFYTTDKKELEAQNTTINPANTTLNKS